MTLVEADEERDRSDRDPGDNQQPAAVHAKLPDFDAQVAEDCKQRRQGYADAQDELSISRALDRAHKDHERRVKQVVSGDKPQQLRRHVLNRCFFRR